MRHEKTIIEHAIAGLESLTDGEVYGCDLHHVLFNQDYFIIGTYEAKKWINEMGGAFEVIDEITEYEEFNFGQVSTDFSSAESVANMYAYILGEKLLNDLKHLHDVWDVKMSDDDIQTIIEELNELL